MEEYTVVRDDDIDLQFKGEELASVCSSDNNASGSSYSGQTGVWQELALYKTKGGKFICERVNRTRWEGDRDSFQGAVCTTLEEVINFFGMGWLAKDLYAVAEIEATQQID